MAITSITRTSPISGNESVVTEGQIVTYTIVSDSPNDRLSATVTAGTAATSRFFSPPFTFVPGGVSTFTISTVDDAIAQNVNQNFFVNFVPEDENVVGDAPLTTINPGVNASNIVTIRDNDVVPPREASTLSIIGSTPNPVSEGVTSVTFQIRYTQGNGNDLGLQSFTVGTIDGTAVGGVGVIGTNGTLNDYNTVTRSFAFGNNPGSSTGNPGLVLAPGATQDFFVTVPILDDSIVEQDETFSLRLSDVVAPPGSVIIGTDTQVATIRDNDGPNVPAPEGRGTVRFEFANYSVVENQPFVELKVIREGGQNGVIQGSLSINTGTSSQAAQLGADFLSPAQTSVFFGDQDTTAKIIRIPIIDNPTPDRKSVV